MGISIVKPHSRDCLSSQASRGYVTLATYFPYTGLLIKIYTCIRTKYCFVSFNVILAFFSKVWHKLIRERVVLEPLVPFFEWLTGSMNGSFYFLPYTFPYFPLKIAATSLSCFVGWSMTCFPSTLYIVPLTVYSCRSVTVPSVPLVFVHSFVISIEPISTPICCCTCIFRASSLLI